MAQTHGGFFIQSSFGDTGNFEFVVPSRYGGLVHFWRHNDDPALPWIGPQLFGCGDVSGASLLENASGGFDVAAVAGTKLVHYHRDARWSGPFPFGVDVAGNPSLIQTRPSNDLHVVAPLATRGFAAFNKSGGAAWTGPTTYAQDAGQFESVALIQSNYGDPGNLEMIAVVRNNGTASLCHFWRDSGPPFEWHGPTPIGLNGAQPKGIPGFVQTTHGTKGNFHVVTPLQGGGMAHVFRDNDSPVLPWSPPVTFGEGDARAVALIQSTFGSGNLEIVACVGTHVQHRWCGAPDFAWSGSTATIFDEPVIDPTTQGEWKVAHTCEPVGIHAALLHTNKVLFFAYHEQDHAHGVSSIFDLETGAVTHIAQDEDLFCAGQAFLPDGRLLVAGGHISGIKSLFLFVPDAQAGSWQQLPDMPEGRWYPTCTALPDGRLLIMSGAKQTGGGPVNDTYAIYDPATGLGPPQPAPFLLETPPFDTYPFVYVLPDGRLVVHTGDKACLLDLATGTFGAERFKTIRAEARTYPLEGTAVLLPLLPDSTPPYRARVMLIGGGGLPPGTHTPATETCEILDMSNPQPAWKSAPSMFAPRVMPDAVLLPDATVLVMNGSAAGKADDAIAPVFQTDLYDPGANQWSAMAKRRIPRLYHATALLLPDATVMTAGTDEAFNPEPFHYPEYRLEIFRPPYLFRGPRPEIVSGPATILYGGSFQIGSTNPASIASAALLRNGAVTHSNNMDQRYVGLRITGRSATGLTIEGPPNANIAPPGQYLLFILDGSKVPSKAKFVRVG